MIWILIQSQVAKTRVSFNLFIDKHTIQSEAINLLKSRFHWNWMIWGPVYINCEDGYTKGIIQINTIVSDF